MCLRPRLPQLPARHKPPTLHPEQKKTFKRRIAKLLVSLPSPLVKHGSSLQRGLRFCLCVTVNVHPFRLVFKTSPSLLCAALSIFVSPFTDGLVSLLFLREDWQVLTMYLAPWRDLPTHAIHRHFVANPVRHDKAPNQPFVFGTRIGNPSHHSKIFSFRRALWTVNCSAGVKWCLAPDCCCSHCHVCRLLRCSQRHRVQRDAEREGSSLRGVLWFYWARGSIVGKVLVRCLRPISRNVATDALLGA